MIKTCRIVTILDLILVSKGNKVYDVSVLCMKVSFSSASTVVVKT